MSALDDGISDVVAFAAWGIDDGIVRVFTHFWPREVEALGRLNAHELVGPDLDGDVWLGKLRLVRDATGSGQGLVTAVQDAYQWLYDEGVAHDDHLVSVHDEATGSLVAAFIYDEVVRCEQWWRQQSGNPDETETGCGFCEGLVESTGPS